MASTKKSMTSELNNFIRHEIEAIRKVSSVPKKNSTPDVSATISPNAVVRHAADQLVESLLRDDITAAAAKLTEEKLAVDGSELLKEAESILESSACQLVEDILRGCNVKSFDVSSDTNADIDGSGSAPKKSKALVDASSPAPISFSLFDLMDSKPGFVIPPRITAYQIIKAYQRETKAKSMSAGRNTAEYDGGMNAACEYSEANEVDQDNSTALELLEKAEDIEDLSPDPDSWETVRKILYNGLTTFFRCDGDIPRESDQSRFLKVHKSLHEKCIRSNVGSVVTTQLWGIAQNIVGSLLLFDQQFENFAAATTGVAENDAPISFSMDLYWDLGQQFLECLSHLASDYVQSCVGNENEIERMMLGIGLILQRSSASCLLAAMDPMAGWFEVWSRFIPPSKLMAVVRVSGLGRDLLQRCNPSKNNVGVQKIFDTLSMKNNITAKEGSQDSNNSSLYDDLLHGQFLQSISVLRTIILQCGGSPDIVNLIHGQAVDWNPKHYDGNEEDNIFSQKIRLLESCDYCLSLDDAQTILKSAEEYLGQCERDYSPTGCVDEILKPFLRILHLAKSHPGMVDASVELLCSETVDILQRLQ